QIYNSSGGTPLIRHSLEGGSGGTGAGWDSSLGTDGGGNLDADPQFTDAALGNLRLQLTSPAIDAGDNSALPADSVDLDGDGDTFEATPFDLDSNPRRVDIPDVPDIGIGPPPIVDLGAYEVQGETQEELPVYLPLILRKH
ncbi:MAG: hypothetical protein GTO03_15275, partial [Planctomycetales bacterium]|nr:hypothetical protein [Planctomycetales bacterium]